MSNNLAIGDSELTGILSSSVKLSSWMDKLAEQEKDAIKDDLDELHPEINDELDEESVMDQQNKEMSPWSPVSANTGDKRIQDDSSRLVEASSKGNEVNADIHKVISSLNTSEYTLSTLESLLSDKFNQRIASRYIKNNYNDLQAKFANDLKPNSLDDYSSAEVSKGATQRVNQVGVHFGHDLSNNDKQTKYTVDDVQASASELIIKCSDSKSILKELDKMYTASLVSQAFATEEDLDKTIESSKSIVYSTIEDFIKGNLLNKKSLNEVEKILINKFGESNTKSYFKNSDVEKLFGFDNSRNDGTSIKRTDIEENSKDIKELTSSETSNYSQIKKEAYQSLIKRTSLKNVETQITSKYGSSAFSKLIEKEGGKLKEAEHKLGYFYTDSNYFDSCDKMAAFFNKHLKNAMLLKKKVQCYDCTYNTGNVCGKTSLILSSNPLHISRRDGKRIIKAVSEMKLVSPTIIESYMKEISSENDNSPIIKSFIQDVKKAIKVARDPFKSARGEVKKTDGKEFRSYFDLTKINDINVNSLNTDFKFADISLANLI